MQNHVMQTECNAFMITFSKNCKHIRQCTVSVCIMYVIPVMAATAVGHVESCRSSLTRFPEGAPAHRAHACDRPQLAWVRR